MARRVAVVIAAIIASQLADVVPTFRFLAGAGHEANPIMAVLLTHPSLFVLVSVDAARPYGRAVHLARICCTKHLDESRS